MNKEYPVWNVPQWDSSSQYTNIRKTLLTTIQRIQWLYQTRKYNFHVAVGLLVGFFLFIVIVFFKYRKQAKPRGLESFWNRWSLLFIKGRNQLDSSKQAAIVVDSKRSRLLFARDLELEIQRCKCKANGKNRAITYRTGYLLQSSQGFSLTSKVVVDILVDQLKQVIQSYLNNAIRYLRSNLVEQCLEEIATLLKFHRQWIKPAVMDWTCGNDVEFQSLFSKLNVRNSCELRTRPVQYYPGNDIYRLYLEQYFASCGKQYTKLDEIENRRALQTYLGINSEEAVVAEEYVANRTYRKAAVQVFENGIIHTERLKYLLELERFLEFTLKRERVRDIYMETAKPFIVKYLWDIIRDQGITLQQAISNLSYLESTLNIELNTVFSNLEEYENDVEMQRKKRTLWKFWQSYKQGMRSKKDTFKTPPSSEQPEKP